MPIDYRILSPTPAPDQGFGDTFNYMEQAGRIRKQDFELAQLKAKAEREAAFRDALAASQARAGGVAPSSNTLGQQYGGEEGVAPSSNTLGQQYGEGADRSLMSIDPDLASNYAKSQTEQAARQTKLIADKTALYRDQLANVRDPQTAARWVISQYKDPDLGSFLHQHMDPEEALAGVPQTPVEFNEWRQQQALGMTKFVEQNKPQTIQRDLGGASEIGQVSGLTGQYTAVPNSRREKTMAPGEAQRIEIARTAAEGKTGAVARISTDNEGNVTHFDNQGNVVAVTPHAGKPTAAFEKDKILRKQLKLDLDSTISELENATAKGGLIEKSTGSGAGALVDMGAGFFGKSTPGAEAVGALAPIYDKVLKMVPRFEGPQSDKDTKSYMAAAGNLANPNVPKSIKLAAATEILRLMKARKSQFISKDIESNGGSVSNGDIHAQADAILRGD